MNKLSELSKPVAWAHRPDINAPIDVTENAHVARNWSDFHGRDVQPLYSQEYVSALLARIAELEGILEVSQGDLSDTEDAMHLWAERAKTAEAKLATPVRLPEGLAQKIKVTGYYEALNEMMDCVRAAGFKCVGDE